MTSTREQEIWKTYLKYPWIEASNLGRVRTKDRIITDKNGKKRFVKGKVLKQQLDINGYMRVEFRVNGKTVYLSVHRTVATCFIPNPNGYPEVNHKDNDRTNNVVNNLEWCTSQYNQNYKKNFGTSSTQVLGRPVVVVDLKTGKVLRFETRSEAACQLGVDISSITRVVKGEQNTIGDYWFTEDESEITEKKIREIKANMQSHPVIAVNPKTSEVFLFKSQHEAERQLGVSQSHICAVIRGQRKTTGGYWFCRADEDAVEKTIKKFGDEIANKVKELM